MKRFRTVWAFAALTSLGLGCQDVEDSPAQSASTCPSADDSVAAQEAYVSPLDDATPAEVLTCAGPPAARSGDCADALGGHYAIAYALDVYWQDEANPLAPGFDPGRGELTLLAHARLGDFCDGERAKATVRACGLDFPALTNDASRVVYQLGIPEATWDRPSMPTILTSAQVSGFGHGDRMMFEPIVAMLGIQLSDALGDWPDYQDTPFITCASGRGAECFPDQDADGQRGITLRVQSTGSAPAPSASGCDNFRYAPVPTSPSYAPHGARELLAGLRLQLRGAQPIGADCNGGTGPMDAAEIALRVLDCVEDDGSPCSAAGATYVDQNLPRFHVLSAGEAPPASWRAARPEADAALDRSPSAGPEQTALRLGDARDPLGCSDVRAAFAR